ncbi:hypothetical protein BKA83DRAFT_4132893 [Pisolithus microcarpus]|nr:hypothetical protein BKA83DRAFT_4132893 [Pisolithus microcarpus]
MPSSTSDHPVAEVPPPSLPTNTQLFDQPSPPMPNFDQPSPPMPNFDQPHKYHPPVTSNKKFIWMCSPTNTQLFHQPSPPMPSFDQPHKYYPHPPPCLIKIIPPPLHVPPSTSPPHQPPTLTSAIIPPVPIFDQPSPPVPNFHQPLHLFQPFYSMARTKQTARKATGGHAQRVNLEVLQKKKAKAKAASKKCALKIPAKANSVIIYLDGGEICLIVSEESMQKVKEADVKFMCMTYHWQKTKNDPKPYMYAMFNSIQGFYSRGQPALSTPPIIPGGFQHAMTSQVAPHPTALVHLHLEGLAQNIGHSQVAMLHSFLQAYFPQGDYNFSQLPFNLGTPESMDAYDKAASDLANTLSAYSKVVLFLTTHSDEDRGDLFTGYINKQPVASKVFPFLQLHLKPLSKIVNGADIIFYVCGSMVTNPQSFNGIKEVAQQSMLLFDAQHLLLAFTVPYLQSLLDNTIIQGFPICSAAKVALSDCGRSSGGRKVSLD